MTELLTYLPDAFNNLWLYVGLLFIVVALVVFIHELGHYMAGIVLGFKVELFAIGFGPELLGYTDRRGTRWSLRLLPLGGYVSFFGDMQPGTVWTEEQKPFVFALKAPWRRIVVAMAGPAANVMFSLLLLIGVYMTIGRPIPPPVVAAVEIGAPADSMGIEIGDRIVKIDGVEISGTDQARELVRNKTGVTLTVQVERNGEIVTLSGAPKNLEEKNEYGFSTHRGYFGWMWPVHGLSLKSILSIDGIDTTDKPDLARKLILDRPNREIAVRFGKDRPSTLRVFFRPEINKHLLDPNDKDYDSLRLGRRPSEDMKPLPIGQATKLAAGLIWRGIHTGYGAMFQIVAGKKEVKEELGGMIKISSSTSKMYQRGLYSFLSFIAILSLALAVFNLLPIPLLDGGNALFYALEAIKGEPLSLRTKGYMYGFGVVFLLLLMLVVNINDLRQALKF